jgi:hypothetical protein
MSHDPKKKRNSPYSIPVRLKTDQFSQSDYKDWLDSKAKSHRKRDNKRWNTTYTLADYRKALHRAVEAGNECDPYTGEPLDWSIVKTYNNAVSTTGGFPYRSKFKNLPTVDHRDPNSKKPDFEIISWQVNTAKS